MRLKKIRSLAASKFFGLAVKPRESVRPWSFKIPRKRQREGEVNELVAEMARLEEEGVAWCFEREGNLNVRV